MARDLKKLLDELDVSHLGELLDQLETLSRYGQPKEVTFAKKKTIVDHVKFLVVKSS